MNNEYRLRLILFLIIVTVGNSTAENGVTSPPENSENTSQTQPQPEQQLGQKSAKESPLLRYEKITNAVETFKKNNHIVDAKKLLENVLTDNYKIEQPEFANSLLSTLDSINDEIARQQPKGWMNTNAVKKFFSDVKNDVGEISVLVIRVLIYIFLASIAIFIIRLIRSGLRKPGISLALEDYSAVEAEKEAKNRNLELLLTREIRALSQNQNLGIVYNLCADQARVETTLGKVADLNEYIDDSEVKIGIFSFSPKQIFGYLARILMPQHTHVLAGALTKSSDDQTLFWVEKRERPKWEKQLYHKLLSFLLPGIYRNFIKPKEKRVEESYSATASGNGARESVVRKVAVQFALANSNSTVTSNWESLTDLLLAEDCLMQETPLPNILTQKQASNDSAGTEVKNTTEDNGTIQKLSEESKLLQAYEYLKRSLRHDPANWMARYKIATVLQLLGHHREASDQFSYLQDMITSYRLPLFPEATDTPENSTMARESFLWNLNYQMALSSGQSNDKRKIEVELNNINEYLSDLEKGSGPSNQIPLRQTWQNRAITRFISFLKPSPDQRSAPKEETKTYTFVELSEENKKREIMLRSARTVINMSLLEIMRRENPTIGDQYRQYEVLRQTENLTNEQKSKLLDFEADNFDKVAQIFREKIRSIENDEDWIWGKRNKIDDWKIYARAHSMAQNARGRAYYIEKNFPAAIEYLNWAIETHLPDTYIDPLINLASVYIATEEERPINWIQESKRVLLQALKIHPSNTKANFLLANCYACEFDYENAKIHFEKCKDHPQSLFQYAKILITQNDETQLDYALKLLARSIVYDPVEHDGKNERIELFKKVVSLQIEDNKNELLKLENLRKHAIALSRQQTSPQLNELGDKFVRKIDRAMLAARKFTTPTDATVRKPKLQEIEKTENTTGTGEDQKNKHNKEALDYS